MKKSILTTIMMLFVCSMALLAQDVQPPADIKEFWELEKWTVILGAVLGIIGILHQTGLDAKLEKHWLGRVLLSTIDLVLGFLGKKYKAYRLKMKANKAASGSKVLKVLLLGVIFTAAGLTTNAQMSFKSLIKPVTVDMITDVDNLRGVDTLATDEKGAWFLRFGGTITGVKFNYSSEAGKLINSEFVRAGIGFNREHYVVSNGSALNNYGYGGYLLFPVNGDPTQNYLSIMISGSALNLFQSGLTISVGIGYDFNPGLPGKDNIFLAPNLKYTF